MLRSPPPNNGNRHNILLPQTVTKICCIGAGYVGGPTCAVIADQCPHLQVTIVDIDPDRISKWNYGPPLPIYEPGLEEIIIRRRGHNLFFSTDVDGAIDDADLIFVSVNTPTKTDGMGAGMAADLKYVESATRMIVKAAKSSKIIVEKSTVPCRTADSIITILESCCDYDNIHFEVLSNPEFLAEGTAIKDLLEPDRILIGARNTINGMIAQNALMEIYTNWISKDRIITTNLWSSELSKLAANAMLAQRISSVNALSAICEATGANIDEVAKAIGLDNRIGSKFLQAGLGFGGSCFRKDILNLVYLCESLKLTEVAAYWKQVVEINEYQKNRFVERIVQRMFHTICNKKIVIFGFAFKKNTGDTRETPAATVVAQLLTEGAVIVIYDPVTTKQQIDREMKTCNNASGNYTRADDACEACKDADAIVICTEWDEFKSLDYQAIYEKMNRPAFIFDGRLILDADQLRNIGYVVETVGKVYDDQRPLVNVSASKRAINRSTSSVFCD